MDLVDEAMLRGRRGRVPDGTACVGHVGDMVWNGSCECGECKAR